MIILDLLDIGVVVGVQYFASEGLSGTVPKAVGPINILLFSYFSLKTEIGKKVGGVISNAILK